MVVLVEFQFIIGILKIASTHVCILFDPEAIHSFISSRFVKKTSCKLVLLKDEMYVSTLNGSVIMGDIICPTCILSIEDHDLTFDLMILEMRDFDVILGMDWLILYHTMMDYFRKRVIIPIPGQASFSFSSKGMNIFVKIISSIQVCRMLRKDCAGYLASVVAIQQEEIKIKNISIAREFSDVFSKDLPGLSLDREIEFSIDLASSARFIFKAPYQMAPVELKELKEQLQKLLNKDFIKPSISPWGALVLFC